MDDNTNGVKCIPCSSSIYQGERKHLGHVIQLTLMQDLVLMGVGGGGKGCVCECVSVCVEVRGVCVCVSVCVGVSVVWRVF